MEDYNNRLKNKTIKVLNIIHSWAPLLNRLLCSNMCFINRYLKSTTSQYETNLLGDFNAKLVEYHKFCFKLPEQIKAKLVEYHKVLG